MSQFYINTSIHFSSHPFHSRKSMCILSSFRAREVSLRFYNCCLPFSKTGWMVEQVDQRKCAGLAVCWISVQSFCAIYLSTKNHSYLISKIEILMILLSFSTLRVQLTNPGQVPSTWQGLFIEFLLPDFHMPHFLTSF